MNRRITGVVGVAAALGLAATALPGNAHAVTGREGAPHQGAAHQNKGDNLPDPLHAKRAATQQAAVDALMKGQAKLKGKGANRVIQMQDGTLASYPVSQSAQLLTFLVDFGSGGNPAFPDNTAGPVHNSLPAPARSDNSTYWQPDFSTEHYKEMFFTGLPDQNGESFKAAYKEMSSGRFDLQGDVSDWVTVPHAESYYQTAVDDDKDPATPPAGDESAANMRAFIQDSANAWYADQVAKGKTAAEIEAYLKSFDVWDRYDVDGDGNFNEPDGYIDHFQAIHAGGGEEAGNDPWTIWSHRWAVNTGGFGTDGPAAYEKLGGIKIGNSDLWIRDYTTEPEDGGLGVFAHEFGHDLGLPDFYDTVAGENSTAFWTLMSSGSWLGHGDGSIGSTPGQMGPTEKLFLGWIDPTNDLAEIPAGGSGTVTLGPSFHATTTGKQILKVDLPEGEEFIETGAAKTGDGYLYSGAGDDRTATATSSTFTVPAAGQLTAKVRYDLEYDYDYTYVQVSSDGGAHWTNLQTNLSHPGDTYAGGIDGTSATCGDVNCDGVPDAWVDLTADLSTYAGQPVKLRFRTANDGGLHYYGFAVDDLAVGTALTSGFEPGFKDWTLDEYSGIEGHGFLQPYEHYYLAENRQYVGYDKTLAEGPYNFGNALSKPNTVEQFPYQDGMLVWYVNSLFGDNNTSEHAGYGQALPVDANPAPLTWSNGSVVRARIQTFDSTFGLQPTDAVTLHRETKPGQVMTLNIPSRPAVPVFDDSDVSAYWSEAAPLISSKVAGTGTSITVVSADDATGQMTVKVAPVAPRATVRPAVSGTPRVGATLSASPGTWTLSPALSYQWLANGAPIAGATGSRYTLKPAQSGKAVSVRVTATTAGHPTGTATSAGSAKVLPAAVSMSVKAPKSVRKGHRATITVTVASPGLVPGGRVTVTYASRTVAAKALVGGRVTITLPAVSRTGRKQLVVGYHPATGFAGTPAKVLTVRVR